MNDDLELRLKPWSLTTNDDIDFYRYLTYNLSYFALQKCKKNAEVIVRVQPIENGEDDSAYMLGDDDHKFEIYLDDRMPFGMIIDFLLHELAHVRSWHHHEEDDHGPEFGRAYAALYRKYLKLYDKWFA